MQCGLPGVMNVNDDILIYGCNRTEHDDRLHAVLQLLQEKGLTLNKQKCIFGQPTLKYMGYIFSKHGISPDPSKVEVVLEATTPRTASEVRSYDHCSVWQITVIPEFVTIIEPFRDLTKKSTKWSLETIPRERLND